MQRSHNDEVDTSTPMIIKDLSKENILHNAPRPTGGGHY